MFMSKVSSLHRQSKSTYLPLKSTYFFSIRDRYRNTGILYQFSYSVQFLMSSLFQIMIGRFTVDGVNHHLTGSNLFYRFQPGQHIPI